MILLKHFNTMNVIGNINSWMHSKEPSLNDKIKELLQIHYKLVLVQADELQRIRLRNDKNKYIPYVDYLYDHYIINELPKTYLCNS